MKLFIVTLLLLIIDFDITTANAYTPPSFFDAALTADRIVKGKINTIGCNTHHKLLCEAFLEHDGHTERIGWMPLYANEPFPILHEDAYFFLKKTEAHPYASSWKKKGLAHYISSDPGLPALPLHNPWAPFFSDWVKTLPENRKNTASIFNDTARFILATLVEHPDVPAKDGLLFLWGHPRALEDPLPTDILATLVSHPPLGQDTEQIRFLDWAAAYFGNVSVQRALVSLVHNDKAFIRVRLHAAQLLEGRGEGPPPSFYETLLRSGDATIIAPTLTVLGAKKTAWSADMLYYAMRDLSNSSLNERALDALVKLGQALAVPRLEAILNDSPHPDLSLLAIRALGKFALPSSITVLSTYLDSPHASISLAAVSALKQIGSEKALEAIRQSEQAYEHREKVQDIQIR